MASDKPVPTLGRDIRNKIGQGLRQHYEPLIEPMNDHFADLVRRLEQAERARKPDLEPA